MFDVQWYVDKPGRELVLPRPGERVWVDIEPGCFTKAEDVRAEGTRITNANLTYGSYGNKPSIEPVFQRSEELAPWALWYANYETPVWSRFEPFNGFEEPLLWQFSDEGLAGINVDLSISVNGELYADFGNYTILSPKTAEILVAVCRGVIIGLQDGGIAQWNISTLEAAMERLHKTRD